MTVWTLEDGVVNGKNGGDVHLSSDAIRYDRAVTDRVLSSTMPFSALHTVISQLPGSLSIVCAERLCSSYFDVLRAWL